MCLEGIAERWIAIDVGNDGFDDEDGVDRQQRQLTCLRARYAEPVILWSVLSCDMTSFRMMYCVKNCKQIGYLIDVNFENSDTCKSESPKKC